MLIRVTHSSDPKASTSLAKSAKDELGGFLVEYEDLEIAKSHGFVVNHLPQKSKVQESEPEAVEIQEPEVNQDEPELDFTSEESKPKAKQKKSRLLEE